MTTTANEILDAAERLARSGGYNGFSFRDVADAVGIKSASVHYHFPTKSDLGGAIAKRYSERFITSLGAANDVSQPARVLVDRFVLAFRRAVIEDGRMCLCGLFAAEMDSLPHEVAAETRRFFEANLNWLTTVLARMPQAQSEVGQLRVRALTIVSALEGAILVARALDNLAVFDDVVSELRGRDVIAGG